MKKFAYLTILLAAVVLGAMLTLKDVPTSVTNASSTRSPVPQYNVIYIMVDTLRADHLGIYGYERNTSPVIDAFAKDSTLYKYAFTPAPWTPPSVASQLSGLYPASHKMLPPRSREKAKLASFRFNSSIVTLPEMLKSVGYNTAGISSNPWITKFYGFDEEFDELTYLHREPAEVINQKAFEMMDELQAKQKPFFMYLHYLDPHNPYKAPAPYRNMYKGALKHTKYDPRDQHMINRYDGEITYLDTQLGNLFNYLKSKNLFENSLIVFTADHGEQFHEQGDHGHGYKLYNSEIHVPMIIKIPKAAPGVVEKSVSLVDLYPTILDVLDIPFKGTLPGISLLNEKALEERRGIMAQISRVYVQMAYIGHARRKLIVEEAPLLSAEEHEDGKFYNKVVGLYDYTSHGEPQMDLPPEILDKLTKRLNSMHSESKSIEFPKIGDVNEVPENVLNELQTLGYF